MRAHAPFLRRDLDELDESFYAKAARVVAMEDVVDGDRAPNVIGLRHDCDSEESLATAVEMARWEQERGYRSTYYILHTSPYWQAPGFEEKLEQIAACGHEIGIHANALAESLRTGENPDLILDRAIRVLRDLGHLVRGAAGHGDPICIRERAEGEMTFANDEQFLECRRPPQGPSNRIITRGRMKLQLAPRPLADFGLEYEALFCAHPFSFRFSDSGGRWLNPGFEETVARFAGQLEVTALPQKTEDPRQLHMLIHPDWWAPAFTAAERLAA